MCRNFRQVFLWREIPAKPNERDWVLLVQATSTAAEHSAQKPLQFASLNGNSGAITYSGSWYPYSPVAGNFGADEQLSSTAGDQAIVYGRNNAVGFEVFGTRGPNRGQLRVYIDGFDYGLVNAYSAEWLPQQSLFRIDNLGAGTHQLRLENVSSVPGQNQVGIDKILVISR